MDFSHSLKNIFGMLSWLMLLFLVVIFYHYSLRYVDWNPDILGYFDAGYQSLKIFLIIGFITSIVTAIFDKIRHSRVIESIVIRRFLPIISFCINLAIWVI